MTKTKTMLPAIILTADEVETTLKTRNPNDIIVANAQVVFGWKFIMVPVSEIVVDEIYQRKQTEAAVNKIIANWNEELYEPVKVVYRNGKFYAWDGGKRLRAQIKMGRNEIVCRLYTDKSMRDEIRLFVQQTECVTKLKPADYFKANVWLGDPIDTIINEVCNNYNVAVRSYSMYHCECVLSDISEARNIVTAHGRECLEWIFDIIEKTEMRYNTRAYSGIVLRVLATLYARYEKEIEWLGKILCENLPDQVNAWLHFARNEYPQLDKRTAMVEWTENTIIKNFVHK